MELPKKVYVTIETDGDESYPLVFFDPNDLEVGINYAEYIPNGDSVTPRNVLIRLKKKDK